MKKRILSGLFALALLVTAGYGVNKSTKSDAYLTDLALANVEALARNESGSGECKWKQVRCGFWGGYYEACLSNYLKHSKEHTRIYFHTFNNFIL